MFGFFKKGGAITVEFLERQQNKPFAVSKVPLAQLPDSFDVATTLDIGNQKWSVVEAVPAHKADFQKLGKVRLVVAPLQTMNPKDILFSLPTINDRMFPTRRASSLDGMLLIHEDDWRQIEFVSQQLAGDVDTELRSIRSIYETKRKGQGFVSLHVRKIVERPIVGSALPFDAVKTNFAIAREYAGFGAEVSGENAIAEDGFAFETTDGNTFFGILDQNRNVVFLCMTQGAGFNESCKALIKSFNLIGVDWCKAQVVHHPSP